MENSLFFQFNRVPTVACHCRQNNTTSNKMSRHFRGIYVTSATESAVATLYLKELEQV